MKIVSCHMMCNRVWAMVFNTRLKMRRLPMQKSEKM